MLNYVTASWLHITGLKSVHDRHSAQCTVPFYYSKASCSACSGKLEKVLSFILRYVHSTSRLRQLPQHKVWQKWGQGGVAICPSQLEAEGKERRDMTEKWVLSGNMLAISFSSWKWVWKPWNSTGYYLVNLPFQVIFSCTSWHFEDCVHVNKQKKVLMHYRNVFLDITT